MLHHLISCSRGIWCAPLLLHERPATAGLRSVSSVREHQREYDARNRVRPILSVLGVLACVVGCHGTGPHDAQQRAAAFYPAILRGCILYIRTWTHWGLVVADGCDHAPLLVAISRPNRTQPMVPSIGGSSRDVFGIQASHRNSERQPARTKTKKRRRRITDSYGRTPEISQGLNE